MPRPSGWLTPLLVAAVLGVAVVSIVDAVRRDLPPAESDAPAAETFPPDLRERLRRAGVAGTLHYVDPDCLKRSLSLPELEVSPAQRVACEDELRPRLASTALGPAFVDGRPRAGCRRAAVELLPQRPMLRRLQGCARDVLPDGSLLVVAGGAVVAVPAECRRPLPRCRRVVLSRADLRRAGARHPNVPAELVAHVGVRDVARLGGERYAVLLEVAARGRLSRLEPSLVVAVLHGRRIVASHPLTSAAPTGLAVSARGSFVAATGVLLLLRRDGAAVPLAAPFARGHAVAWSPDERWTAVATRASVLLVATDELLGHSRSGSAPSLVRLPLAARELAWGRE